MNGTRIEEPSVVRHAVKNHFMIHFSETWAERPKLSGQFKNIGGRHVADLLEAEFTEEEVKYVITSCDGNKAPRSDGFNLTFFKKCWRIVKPEVMQFFRAFHRMLVWLGV